MRINQEIIGGTIRVASLLSMLSCACGCGGRAASDSQQQTCLVQDDCEPGNAAIDAGAFPMVLPPECTGSGTCAGSGRCVEGICAPFCTDLPDLVIPEGEHRFLEGTAAYCNVIIAGTPEVQSYDGTAGGRLELIAVERGQDDQCLVNCLNLGS
jgi:hypothetical protein